MPTYDYQCSKCNHRFEMFQSMTEKPRQRCPLCRGKVERLISGGSGLLFKGSGFYITDYRSDGYKKAAKEDSPDKKPDSSSSQEKKSESSNKTSANESSSSSDATS